MTLHYLIRLKRVLSDATLNDVAAYMKNFTSDKCLIEAQGPEVFIKFSDEQSVELFRRQFPDLIENNEHHNDTSCADD